MNFFGWVEANPGNMSLCQSLNVKHILKGMKGLVSRERKNKIKTKADDWKPSCSALQVLFFHSNLVFTMFKKGEPDTWFINVNTRKIEILIDSLYQSLKAGWPSMS